jgi:aminoglycoside/choline kinase family phosphotransferase
VEAGYPTTADELDPDWLTSALGDRHPGVRVTAVEVLERHDLTNARSRLALTYAEPDTAAAAGAPATVFCKLPPTDERRAAIIATGMGQKEARFYESLAPLVPLRVPAVHVARQDDDTGLFVLVLEDLVAAGCAVSDGTWGIPADAVAANHRDRLTDAFVAVSDVYCDHRPALHALWQEGPRTVVHGDAHIGNLFLDEGRLGFLDWGVINAGPPMRDVGYLLTMGMDIEERRTHQEQLVRLYVDALAAEGGPELGFDEAWAMHRLHAAYTVPASCQVVTFPADMTDARRVFSDAFLARCLACLDDLEAVAALGERGLGPAAGPPRP